VVSSTLSAVWRSGAVAPRSRAIPSSAGRSGASGVPAPCFVIAADQLGSGAVEVEDFRRYAFNGRKQCRQPLGVEATAPCIHAHRDRHFLPSIALAVNEVLEQGGGEIVDAIPSHIFKRSRARLIYPRPTFR
jgi:hypothetical protein